MPEKGLYKIEEKEYARLRPIVADLAEIHLNVIAVLAGTCPGEVYVDDLDQPRSVYLISDDGHFLAGDAHNPAFNTAVNAALPRDTCFVLFCDPERWAGALDVVLADTYAIRASRHYYTLRPGEMADRQAPLPAGLWLRPVDAGLLAQDLENRDAVVESLLDTWLSVETFLARGFGFCLTNDATIVSWSLADFVQGPRCEMGIYTEADHRRQGFGTRTASATAGQALARGRTPVGWHCWANNAGSIGVAKGVGFQKAAEYEVFINHWAAENVSDTSPDEFRAFAEDYERQFEANPPAASGYPHLVAATAWALARDRAGCFRHLHKAADLGWLQSVEHLRQVWPEFFWNPNLDEMEEWQILRQRLETEGEPS